MILISISILILIWLDFDSILAGFGVILVGFRLDFDSIRLDFGSIGALGALAAL